MFQRLQWKIFGLIALVVVGAAVASAGVASVLIRSEIEGILADALRDKGQFFREHFSDRTDAQVDAICKREGEKWGVRFTVIAADGVVRGDTSSDPATMVNHASRPEIAAAMKTGYGRDARRSQTESVEYLYVAILLREKGAAAGVIRTAMPLHQVAVATRRAYEIIAWAGGGALGVALLLGLWGSRRITAPIAPMIRFAGRVADGDFSGSLVHAGQDEVGSLGAALLQMRDQLRERMASVERERHRQEAILAGMNEGLVATDADHRVVFVNPAARRLLHLESRDAGVSGMPLHEICRWPELNELVALVEQTGQPHNRQLPLPDRPEIVLHLYVGPIRTATEHPGGLICVMHDITEQSHLDRMRIDFVANASHELKTPLSSIIGALETLEGGAAEDPQARTRFIEIAAKNARRLHALVSDLLDLSRIESAEFTVEPETIQVDAFLDRVRAAFSDRLSAGRLALEIQVAEGAQTLQADPDLLDQALYNLIDNSIKYTPEGGRIIVTAAREDGQFILSVCDTGVGIPPKDLPRLFERFYRVDQARSRELGGTGLGLAIVKHIAMAHGGQVKAESQPGQGTTIRIFLPATDL